MASTAAVWKMAMDMISKEDPSSEDSSFEYQPNSFHETYTNAAAPKQYGHAEENLVKGTHISQVGNIVPSASPYMIKPVSDAIQSTYGTPKEFVDDYAKRKAKLDALKLLEK